MTILFPHRAARILGIAGCTSALFVACAGSAGSFFGKDPRDFIEVSDISEVPESDPFTVRDLRIEEDSLKFTAAYGGGCREHAFTLYAAPAKDSANTGYLYVQHNANNDLCRAMINDDSVAFSLAGLRSALDLKDDATLVFPQVPPAPAGLNPGDSTSASRDSASASPESGAATGVSLTY